MLLRLLVYKNLCHNDICTLMFCVLYLSLLIINISFLMRAFSFLCYRKTADFLNEAFGVNEDDIYRVFAVAFTNDFSHSCSHSGQVKWRLRWPGEQVTKRSGDQVQGKARGLSTVHSHLVLLPHGIAPTFLKFWFMIDAGRFYSYYNSTRE